MEQSQSRKVLIWNAVAMACFVVLLFALNLYLLNQTNTRLLALEESYNRKTETLSEMMLIVRERTLAMMGVYLAKDAWVRDEQFINFNRLAADFVRTRAEMDSIPMQPSELQALDTIFAIIRRTEPLQVDIVDRILSGGDTAIQSDIMTVDLPLEYQLLAAFEELQRVVRTEYHRDKQQVNDAYLQSVYIASGVTVAVMVLMVFLVRHALRRVLSIETGLRAEKASLSWDVAHDSLTGTYNRRWLHNEFTNMRTLGRRGVIHSVLYIDLDDFKSINDQYGHEAGDLYLQEVVRVVGSCIRRQDSLVRIGGDEFVVLLQGCDQPHAYGIAECVLSRLSSMQLQYGEATLQGRGCCVGMAEFNEAGASFDAVLQRADAACLLGKRSGKNRLVVGDS